MKTFLTFLWNNPFFAVCFLFYLIPFWVPLIAILAGTDPILMLLLSAMSIMSRSHIESEIMASGPFNLMFRYFITSPFKAVFKFIFAVSLVIFILIYAMQGEPIDKGIAAVLIVFIIKFLYFRPKKGNKYWNIQGLKAYRFYSIAGRASVAVLWLIFFCAGLTLLDNALVAFLAILISALTFYKTNEGLI